MRKLLHLNSEHHKNSIFGFDHHIKILLLFFIIHSVSSSLYGQIVYTDLVPDFGLGGNNIVRVDINNDDITDLTFVSSTEDIPNLK